MFPRRREEKERICDQEGEGGAEGMDADGHRTGEPGHPTPGLVGSRAHQSASPVPFCFALKQAVGIFLDPSALRDGPRLDLNRGQWDLGSECS